MYKGAQRLTSRMRNTRVVTYVKTHCKNGFMIYFRQFVHFLKLRLRIFFDIASSQT